MNKQTCALSQKAFPYRRTKNITLSLNDFTKHFTQNSDTSCYYYVKNESVSSPFLWNEMFVAALQHYWQHYLTCRVVINVSFAQQIKSEVCASAEYEKKAYSTVLAVTLKTPMRFWSAEFLSAPICSSCPTCHLGTFWLTNIQSIFTLKHSYEFEKGFSWCISLFKFVLNWLSVWKADWSKQMLFLSSLLGFDQS